MENLHPLVVHFPIALLVLYSLLELLSLIPRARQSKTIRYIKLFLLIVGWLGVQAALVSGEAAQDAWHGIRSIIEWHETFANLTVWFYGISLIGYVLQWYLYDGISTAWWQKIVGTPLHRFISGIAYFLRRFWIYYLLALAGILALTATGALWGAMVYGVEADPVVVVLVKLLHITY